MSYLLLVCVFVLFCIALILSKGFVVRPSVLVLGTMTFSCLATIYLSFNWDFNLSISTVFLICLSMAFIIFGDNISKVFIKENHTSIRTIPTIKIYNNVLYLILLFQIVILIWHLRYLINSVGRVGSLLQIVNTYRNYHAWGIRTDMINAMPSLLSRGIRLANNFSYIYLFVFISNVVKTGKIKKNLRCLLPSFFMIADTFLWGARGYLFYYIMGGIMYTCILLVYKKGYKKRTKRLLIRKATKIICVLLVLFTIGGYLFSRSTEGGFLLPICRYLGGGIPLFNDYLQKDFTVPNYTGETTFFTLFQFLNRRFGTELPITTQFEYRNRNWGNIYTGVRRYFQDFGAPGVIILSFIFGLIFGLYHNYVFSKKRKVLKPFDIRIIFYGMLAKGLFLFFMDDLLFTLYFAPSTVVTILELFICIVIVKYKSKVEYYVNSQ